MKASILFLVLLLGAACSKTPQTTAKLAVTLAGLSAPPGGMIVTGKRLNGESFSQVMSEDSISLDLANGSWNFLVVSWDGAAPFNGKVRCSFKKNIQLNGTPVDLLFSISNAECGNTQLSVAGSWDTSSTPNDFFVSDVHLCRSSAALTSFPAACAFSTTVADPYGAAVGSLQFSVPNSTQSTNGFITETGSGLEHSCLNVNPVTGAPKLPAFTSDFYFPLRFRSFFKAGCTGKSIDAYMNDGTVAMTAAGAINKFYAHYSDDRVCAIANSGTSVTALNDIGLGVSNRPYAICNLAQLKDWQNNIGGTPSYQTAPVYLMKSLNLIGGVKFRNSDVTPNAYAQCSGDSSTFVPIGLDASNCTSATSVFNGSLHGLGNTLTNVRFKPMSGIIDEVGLFKTLGGTVAYLNLDKVEFEGDDYVGSVAGTLAATGNIHHVKVKQANIEAKMSYAGGIIGSSDKTGALTHLQVADSRIRGNSNLGGIVGLAAGPIEDSRFSGFVTSESQSGAMYFGGIVGQGTVVTRAVSSGLVSGPQKVGGIAGQLGGAATYTRAIAAVISNDPATTNIFLGGIVGSGSTVANSYFAGEIRYSCPISAACEIGEIAGSGSVIESWSLDQSIAANYGGTAGTTLSPNNSAVFTVIATNICPSGTCSTPSTQWNFTTGSLPRLDFEDHECENPSYQVSLPLQLTTGALGSAAQPAKICNYSQLSDLGSTQAEGKFIELADDIAIDNNILSVASSLKANFNGTDQFLIGGGNGAGSFNLLSTIESNGVVRNLHLIGQSGGNGSDDEYAALAHTNKGRIQNVHASHIRFEGPDIAGLVFKNDAGAIIEHVDVHADLEGTERIGGIAVENFGTIAQTQFKGSIFFPSVFSSDSTDPVGGIAAENNNILSRVAFAGRIDLDGDSTASISGGAGAIAGSNTGAITDAFFDADGSIYYSAETPNIIGGLVGEMLPGSTLTRGVALGSVQHDGNISPIANVSGFIGLNAGTVSNSFFNIPSLEYQLSGPSSFTGTSICTGSQTAANGTYYLRSSSIDVNFVEVTVVSNSFSYQNPSLASCASGGSTYYRNLNAEVILPFPHPTLDPTQFANLSAFAGYSILNVLSNTDAVTILNGYRGHIALGTLTPPATWTWEDGQPRLFFFND